MTGYAAVLIVGMFLIGLFVTVQAFRMLAEARRMRADAALWYEKANKSALGIQRSLEDARRKLKLADSLLKAVEAHTNEEAGNEVPRP